MFYGHYTGQAVFMDIPSQEMKKNAEHSFTASMFCLLVATNTLGLGRRC